MRSGLMTLNEMARYIGVSSPRLVRAMCNRGTLAGIPLPQATESAPLAQRHWRREEVRQFKHALQRAKAAQSDEGIH